MKAPHLVTIIAKRDGDLVARVANISDNRIDSVIEIFTNKNGVGYIFDIYEQYAESLKPFHYETRETLMNGKIKITPVE